MALEPAIQWTGSDELNKTETGFLQFRVRLNRIILTAFDVFTKNYVRIISGFHHHQVFVDCLEFSDL